jgi:hypothetical protein
MRHLLSCNLYSDEPCCQHEIVGTLTRVHQQRQDSQHRDRLGQHGGVEPGIDYVQYTRHGNFTAMITRGRQGGRFDERLGGSEVV